MNSKLKKGQFVRHDDTGFIGRVLRQRAVNKTGRRLTLVRECDIAEIVGEKQVVFMPGREQWIWDHELELIEVRRVR